MERGFFHFNHKKIGKKTDAPEAAKNFTWYMGGFFPTSGICTAILAVGLALPAQGSLAQKTGRVADYALQVEKTSRKNARIADTFHIGLPHCMSKEQMHDTVKAYLWSLTKGGQAKAVAFVQGANKGNIHFHVMFFDRDDQGKRVQQMSELGSTERMAKLWDVICNSKLEEFGYHVRVDHRSLDEQKRNPRDYSQVQEAQSEIIVEPLSTVEEIAPRETEADPQQLDEEVSVDDSMREEVDDIDRGPVNQEAIRKWEEVKEHGLVLVGLAEAQPDAVNVFDRLADHIAQLQDDALKDLDEPYYTVDELVQGAIALDNDRKWLSGKREKIRQLRTAAEEAEKAAETSLAYANQQEKKSNLHRDAIVLASKDLAKYTRADGSKKGFELKWFGRKYISKSRRKANEFEGEIALHEKYQTDLKKTSSHHYLASSSHDEAARLHREHASALERQLRTDADKFREEAHDLQRTYGEPETLMDTDKALEQGIQTMLGKLTPKQIVAAHENGEVYTEDARRALELMGAPEYLSTVEHWENKLQEHDNDYEME